MNTQKIEKAILQAWKLAEDRQDGDILIQLAPSNTRLIVSWQLGNSWEGMGLNAQESQNRILWTFPCHEYEPMYWEGEKHIEANRLDAQEQNNDLFTEICNEIETQIEGIIKL